MSFRSVSIIYNPKSAGTSKRNATELQRRLQKDPAFTGDIQIVPTKQAGHAETLAYKLAMASPQSLIISASGDGGYNEVVNGVMKARAEGAEVTTGLLPSGNANDHYHCLTSGEAAQLISKGKTRTIDLLHIAVKSSEKNWERYAHSYIGLGLTVNASIRYNQNKLNPVNEWVISIQEISRLRPSEVLIDGQVEAYDSLLISNINRLGKLFFISAASRVDDGKFEIVALKRTTKLELLRQLARAMTTRTSEWEQGTEFHFQTIEAQKIQMDGEVHDLPAKADVTITIQPKALACII